MELQLSHQDSGYDTQLDNIKHFQLYPELKPWIGDHYDQQKILVVAESHSMEKGNPFQHDAETWYQKRADIPDTGWMTTRGIVVEDCHRKGKTIIKVIGSALIECDFLQPKFDVDLCSACRWIGFMHFFQRPVDNQGVEPASTDIQHSNAIFQQVVEALSPRMVVFVSARAYDCLRPAILSDRGIPYERSTHPRSQWWNKAGKGNPTGKERFINLINQHARA